MVVNILGFRDVSKWEITYNLYLSKIIYAYFFSEEKIPVFVLHIQMETDKTDPSPA